MSSEIIAAIIGAIATLAATFIAIFITKKKKGSDPILNEKEKYYYTISDAASDIEKYIKKNIKLKNHIIKIFSIDLEMVLPTLEKLSDQYFTDTEFHILVIDPSSEFINKKLNRNSSYYIPTLEKAIDRLKLINQNFIDKRNKVILKKSNFIYSFSGTLIDDNLYYTLLIFENGFIYTKPPFQKIERNACELNQNIIKSFESWFQFYWDNASTIK